MWNRTMLQALVYLAAFLCAVGAMLFSARFYQISVKKALISVVALAGIGFAGLKLIRLIERGSLNGQSFYGAVFIIPMLSPLLARAVRVKTYDLLDMSTPCLSAILAVCKINCKLSGCCRGIVIGWYVNEYGELSERLFPNRALEAACGVILCAAMLACIRKSKLKGRLYPIFMVSYGIMRIFVERTRQTKPFIDLLSAGEFWSILSILAGIVWLRILLIQLALRRKKK